MKIALFGFVAVCIALAQARPAKHSLNCRKSGVKGNLVGYNDATKNKASFQVNTMAGAEGPKVLHEVSNPEQEFEFYVCDAPDNYNGANFGGKFGQVHPVGDSEMCLTAGSIVEVCEKKDEPDFKEFSKGSRITLEPCASEEGTTLRRQWFALGQGNPACPAVLSLDGAKSDMKQPGIGVNKDGSGYLQPNIHYNMDMTLFLGKQVPGPDMCTSA